MWKSKKFILLLVLAAVIVAGSVAGVVYAQGEDEEEDVPSRVAILERVADKLGIDPQQLKDAFTEVINEVHAEFELKWIDKAVEEGLITEEEAAAYSEWWSARPDVDFGFGGLGHRGPLGFGRFQMRGGCGFGVWHIPGAE
ncbi:MAG TPA: hypothetical protein G4O18_09320 [Dehalococcoidia bacterium]|nr:hypothetical protein [Dehalococcoidia bacterium]